MRDISNLQFGRLTALYPTKRWNVSGSIFWHCRCTCGMELEVAESQLVSQQVRSCGCLVQEFYRSLRSNGMNKAVMEQYVCNTALGKLKHDKPRKNNTSGFRGIYCVHPGEPDARYNASIGFKQRKYHIGSYPTMEAAIQARLKAERLLHDGFVAAYRLWQDKVKANPSYATEHPLIFDVEKVDGELKVTTSEPDALLEIEQEQM